MVDLFERISFFYEQTSIRHTSVRTGRSNQDQPERGNSKLIKRETYVHDCSWEDYLETNEYETNHSQSQSQTTNLGFIRPDWGSLSLLIQVKVNETLLERNKKSKSSVSILCSQILRWKNFSQEKSVFETKRSEVQSYKYFLVLRRRLLDWSYLDKIFGRDKRDKRQGVQK